MLEITGTTKVTPKPNLKLKLSEMLKPELTAIMMDLKTMLRVMKVAEPRLLTNTLPTAPRTTPSKEEMERTSTALETTGVSSTKVREVLEVRLTEREVLPPNQIGSMVLGVMLTAIKEVLLIRCGMETMDRIDSTGATRITTGDSD